MLNEAGAAGKQKLPVFSQSDEESSAHNHHKQSIPDLNSRHFMVSFFLLRTHPLHIESYPLFYFIYLTADSVKRRSSADGVVFSFSEIELPVDLYHQGEEVFIHLTALGYDCSRIGIVKLYAVPLSLEELPYDIYKITGSMFLI